LCKRGLTNKLQPVANPSCGSGRANKFGLQFLTSALVFQSATAAGRRNTNATPALGFMQVGHDLVTSANCKSQLLFRPTNIYQLLYLTSSTYFQSAAVMGRWNFNSQPA